MTGSDDELRARIALRISKDRNRDLLRFLFSDQEVVEMTDSVPGGTDLCLVDETGVETRRDKLSEWKGDQHPVFAPVFLLTASDVDDPWQQYAEELSGVIDAIKQIPAPKSAISARAENLLEMRVFSQRLAAENQLTERVFETSPIGKVVLDTDGIVVRVNQRAAGTFGLTKASFVGQSYSEGNWTAVDESGNRIPEDQLPFNRVIETGEPVYGYEYSLQRPGADPRWLSVNMAPIRDETGEVEYVVGSIEDITLRRDQTRQLERQLERQLDLFEKTQTLANVGAWEYDFRTGEVYWTVGIARIHGLEPDATLDLESSIEYFHPEDRPLVERAFQRAVEDGEPYDLECRLVDESGTERWVRTRGEPQYEDGELVRIRGSLQDVTDRKRRELELRRMRRAVDEAPIGVVISDPTQEDNPLTYVNDHFLEVTGYDRETVLDQNCRFLQGPDTDPETVATIRRAIDAEEPVSVVIRNYRADGTEFWNRLDIAPMRDESGMVESFIGFQRDVTDRIERQHQIERVDRYLRHNLRNKLTVISGMAELIVEEGSPSVEEYAERLLTTADTLMANAETERQVTVLLQGETTPTTVALGDCVASTIDEMRSAYPDATVSASGHEGVSVRAVSQLDAAIRELIDNAIRHNDGDAPTVTVEVSETDDAVVVRVIDDGPGIPPMETDVLQGRREPTDVYHGRGLGLWFVDVVVRRSGGSVEFTTDEGTTVTVRLPRGDGD